MIVANLVGHEEEHAALITHAIPQLLSIVRAHLMCEQYDGRAW